MKDNVLSGKSEGKRNSKPGNFFNVNTLLQLLVQQSYFLTSEFAIYDYIENFGIHQCPIYTYFGLCNLMKQIFSESLKL